jgi:hypothetical protein
MIDFERDSINTLDASLDKVEQDAEIARQRIRKLATQLEAETRRLRLHKDVTLDILHRRWYGDLSSDNRPSHPAGGGYLERSSKIYSIHYGRARLSRRTSIVLFQ